MIKYELKKIFFKQWGLIALLITMAAEIVTLSNAYPKMHFVDDDTAKYYNEYADVYSGKLSADKEKLILNEHELMIDAQNHEYIIEEKLSKNEYNSRGEYLSEYNKIRKITKRSDAFDMYFEKYNYAKEKTDTRYIISSNFNGLTNDFPDAVFLIFAIFITSNIFLTEESSNMFTLIKSYGCGRKTFYSKIISLFITLIFTAIFIFGIECFIILFRCDISELKYPIQSIAYFQNCSFNISIFQGFVLISTIRLFGTAFIVSLVIALSVFVRKPMFVLFIPSAICLIQQFMFKTATFAYYLPTGLLRASGYLRGDSYETLNEGSMIEETIKIFSEIPLIYLFGLIVFVIAFANITFFSSLRHYSGSEKNV